MVKVESFIEPKIIIATAYNRSDCVSTGSAKNRLSLACVAAAMDKDSENRDTDSQTINGVHSLVFPLYALLLRVPDLITISVCGETSNFFYS